MLNFDSTYRGCLSEERVRVLLKTAADGLAEFVSNVDPPRGLAGRAPLTVDLAGVRWLEDAVDEWLVRDARAIDADGETDELPTGPALDELFERDARHQERRALFGAFLGEAMIRVHGGRWVWHAPSRRWGIERADGRGFGFPFSKVDKRVDGDLSDSLVGMMTVLEARLP